MPYKESFFDLNEFKSQTLAHILIRSNLCSARTVKHFLKIHEVSIANERILESKTFIDDEEDIFIDGNILKRTKNLYIIMNKIAGEVCSKTSNSHSTVYERFENHFTDFENIKFIHSIGRLDAESEGLLLFTTNGDFSHAITDPKSGIKKEYFVILENPVSKNLAEEYVKKSKTSIKLLPEKKASAALSMPFDLKWIDKKTCIVEISEGKFHHVKRIFTALGNKVLYLKRLSIGSLQLPENLLHGEFRNLTENEIKKIFVK